MTDSESPSTASILFARGVLARLRTWPSLTLAIAEGWGGASSHSKLPWLAGVLVDSFEDPPPEGVPDAEYVEALLLQIMEDEFDCSLEDESAWDVAKDVVRCWEAIGRGAKEGEVLIVTWEEKADKMKGKRVVINRQGASEDEETDGEDEDEDAEMENREEAPQLVVVEHPTEKKRPDPIVDEDGFELVQSKGKKR